MGYLITGNRVADGLLRRVDRVTESDRATTAVLVAVAVILAVLLSGPGSALIGHMTGLVLGLFAGRIRLLHLRRG
jgi:ABC-type microcin C transport system permease subunit YejE